MFYITGDTHGDFERYEIFADKTKANENDVMIVLGDAGLNYYGNEFDYSRKQLVNSFPFTTFCIHGNHERRPGTIPTYKMKEFCGGMVWYEEAFPHILFAKDGEIYKFGDYSCVVLGGAYSVDKYQRLIRGWHWFEDEQPSDEIKAYAENQLENHGNSVDIVLSHTCPEKYEPVECFISGVDQSRVDSSTEKWLDKIEERISYKRWYCGHYHICKKIDKIRFMFFDIDELKV